MIGRILTRLIIGLCLIAPASAIVQPKIIQTPSGLTAWYTYDSNTPVISITFAFKGGARLDPKDKAGVASMTANILSSGTMKMDPSEFDAYQQDYAIQLGFNADADQLGGSMATLVENKEKAFSLLQEVLHNPRLMDDIFLITKNQTLTALANIAKDPSYLATRWLQTKMFKGHPYQYPAQGLPETVEKITLQDVSKYIKDNLTKDRLIIAVNGNISEEETKKVLDQIFGSMPKADGDLSDKRLTPVIDGTEEIIDLQIPQSIIYFALPGIMYDDPDFLKAALLMHIMGEDQSSRLYKEVRQKRSLAYAVSASLVWMQEAGYIIGMAGTTKAKSAETVQVLKEEWARLKKAGITQEELDNAKDFMLNAYPLNFHNTPAIAKILLSYQLTKRPVDYFQKREEMIKKISLKEMNDFITKTIDPSKLTMVIVGRPDANDTKGTEETQQPK